MFSTRSGLRCLALLTVALATGHAGEPTWKAGTARTIITPTNAMWMAGYSARTRPAEGKLTDLWLKALALEDASGHRAVVITADLVGIKQPVYHHIRDALKQKYGLESDQFLFCASHTHCGPLLRGSSRDSYAIDASQLELVESYSDDLENKTSETVGRALADLGPVSLASGQGQTSFAVNRRNNSELEVPQLIQIGGLKGPTDHSVPVLAAFLPDGKLKGVFFGYACHNTTMDLYKWCGDYAGFAQTALEQSHPEATALFFNGCGGDQNPLPRHQLELAQRYGGMLAGAVEEALLAPCARLPPTLETRLDTLTLHLGPSPTKAELVKLQNDPSPITRRWATRLMAEARAGQPFTHAYPYPVTAWRFGKRQLLIGLAGEPVVDYAARFKKEFGPQTWIAGYCNEVMTYIPSRRVLEEDKLESQSGWGYEGHRALMFAGLPAYRWSDDVEEVITRGVEKLVKDLRKP